MAFTAAVIVNTVALVAQKQAVWVGLLALFPLILLMLTGLYLFMLPYVPSSRGGRTGNSQEGCGESIRAY